MDKTMVDDLSIVKNSVIGENVNFKGKALNAIISDNVKLKNVIVKNCKIWPNKKIKNKNIEHDV